MNLEIVTDIEEEILHTVCDEVEVFDKSLKKLSQKMEILMKNAKGLGLAAPQVGLNIRFILVVLGFDTKEERVLTMVNPEITYESDEKVIGEEGCLSVPGTFGNVERCQTIVVSFQDIKGRAHTLKLSEMDARVVLHEIDHLNGVLFTERLVTPLIF
jgi:methionyl-tRNA formyltransferase